MVRKLLEMGLCPLGVVLVAAALATSGAQVKSQAKSATLEEKFTPGMVRFIGAQRSVKIELSQWFDEDFKTETSLEFSRQYIAHDWFTKVSNNNPTEVWRSYEEIKGKEKREDKNSGLDPLEVDAVDMRSGQTFVMAIEGGKRKVVGEYVATVEASDIAAACADFTPRLFAGKSVSIGDSWKIPAEALNLPFGANPADVVQSAECTVRLAGLTDAADELTAHLTFSGKLVTYLEVINEFEDAASTRLTTTWQITGEAEADVKLGRLNNLKLTSKAEATGKINGASTRATATGTENFEFRYGSIIDAPVDNGKDGPDNVTDLHTAKLDKVADGHLVIARNGEIGRLQVLDPSTGKIVKTIAALPKGIYFDQIALSKSRKQVAFVSNANSLISIADCNVFVLDTAAGKVNQVTPHWASGDGIAQPLKTAKTGTIRGRLVWYDNEYNRDRSDRLNISAIRVDQTACFAKADGEGRFEIKDVPVGVELYLYAWAMLPAYSNGKPRHLLGNKAIASTVALLADEGVKDIGDLKIHTPAIDNGFVNPTFASDHLWCHYSGVSHAYRVGLAKRDWKEVQLGGTLMLCGGLSAAADGRTLCLVNDGNLRFFDAENGKERWSTGVTTRVSYDASSAWSSAPQGCLVTSEIDGWRGTNRFGVPLLLFANPAEKFVGIARRWPQFAGCKLKATALADERIAYFVLHIHDPVKNLTYGDLWMWDSRTDTTRRLTSLGDVVGVAALGR